VMATHEATFVDIMQQRVVELSQGIVVRDEQGGGYGETASIPVQDLTEAGAQVLRASEEVVRVTLTQDLRPGGVGMTIEPEAAKSPAVPPVSPIPPVAAAPAQAAAPAEEDIDDQTLRAERGAQSAQIPEFLRPAQADPVTLAESNNSLAERLGL